MFAKQRRITLILLAFFLCLGCGSTTMETGKISEKKTETAAQAVTAASGEAFPISLKSINLGVFNNPNRWLLKRRFLFKTLWNIRLGKI